MPRHAPDHRRAVLDALRIPVRGEVYSLQSGWWPRMPMHPAHPSFEVLTYRTPRGARNQGDLAELRPPANTVGFASFTELIMGTAHSGTHIDALCHVACGDPPTWHGGGSPDERLGDFGALEHDAAALQPFVARGVLLDIPRLLGIEQCERHHAITADELQRAARDQAVDVRDGDVVLVRTGQMRHWPDAEGMAASEGSGVSLDGARWLSSRGIAATGADTMLYECSPSGVPGEPVPVHVHMLRECGIPLIEWVNCEALARDGVFEFTFICLPLGIRGASGSMVNPIAIS